MPNKKVTIYTTPSCVYCRAAKTYFEQNNVSYEEHDVLTDLARREEMVKKSSQLGVPVIIVSEPAGKEEVVIGFDQPRLAAVLGL